MIKYARLWEDKTIMNASELTYIVIGYALGCVIFLFRMIYDIKNHNKWGFLYILPIVAFIVLYIKL